MSDWKITEWTNDKGCIDESKFTDKTLARFMSYVQDAGNWGGKPYVGGNVGGDPADKGFVCNMKKRGWITTEWDDAKYTNADPCAWITFTEAGIEKAAEYGEDIVWTITFGC